MTDEPMLFIKLRGAIFTEYGYALQVADAVPGGLRRDAAVDVVVHDPAGRVTAVVPVPGCSGSTETRGFVHLTAYKYPATARENVRAMTSFLKDASAGNEAAKVMLASAWFLLLSKEMLAADVNTKLTVLEHFLGQARVNALVSGRAGVLDEFDPAELADEAMSFS